MAKFWLTGIASCEQLHGVYLKDAIPMNQNFAICNAALTILYDKNCMYLKYGNTGCGVFKGGIQNLKGSWL